MFGISIKSTGEPVLYFQGRYKIKRIESEPQLKNNFVYIATNPVGIRMPAVNIEWRCFKSEEKIHAERGVLNLYLSQTKEGTEHYGTYIAFRDAILAIFNRNEGQPLTEIDVPSNEGLRVVMILKQKCIFEFSTVNPNIAQDKGKHSGHIGHNHTCTFGNT